MYPKVKGRVYNTEGLDKEETKASYGFIFETFLQTGC